MRHIDQPTLELERSENKWKEKFPRLPYTLVGVYNMLGDKSFPPKMMIDLMRYNPKTFKFTPSAVPLFSLDLTQAVKRQIAFARKITAIYPTIPFLMHSS
jgi:hypothetical protein